MDIKRSSYEKTPHAEAFSLIVRERDVFAGDARPVCRLGWDGSRLVIAGNQWICRYIEELFPGCKTVVSQEAAEILLLEVLASMKTQGVLEAELEPVDDA